jgi:hypothetical protein
MVGRKFVCLHNCIYTAYLPHSQCTYENTICVQVPSWTYKDTKTKCRLYKVYSRVHRLEIQSVMLEFSTQLCELLPSLIHLQHQYTDSV